MKDVVNVEVTQAESELVMQGLDLLKAQDSKIEKSASNLKAEKITKEATGFYAKIEELKQKFL